MVLFQKSFSKSLGKASDQEPPGCFVFQINYPFLKTHQFKEFGVQRYKIFTFNTFI